LCVCSPYFRLAIHAPAYAIYHQYGSHMRSTLSRVLLWASVGVPPFWEASHLCHAALAGLSGGPGWWGLHGFRLSGFLRTGCCSLVCGVRLFFLWAGDVESNPGSDRGPCVACGQTPVENARCSEGCGRECHYKEACSGLQRGHQRQGNWVCGMCVVVDSQATPLVALSQPFGQGFPSSQLVPSSHTKPHRIVHQFAPVGGAVPAGAAQCPPGEVLGLVLLSQIQALAGVGGWPWERSWCCSWDFPPASAQGWLPGSAPTSTHCCCC
jgi:hypothetical protein